MNAVRIRKRLEAAIPGLPELTPLVGKMVEIIVLEEPDGTVVRQRARVTGRLESAADEAGDAPAFTLSLDTGEVLRGHWGGGEPSPVPALSSWRAVLNGTATFDPSGGLVGFEADVVEAARPAGDDLFSRLPRSPVASTAPAAFRVPQGPGTGADALFGGWPGDETDEEIRRSFEEIGG